MSNQIERFEAATKTLGEFYRGSVDFAEPDLLMSGTVQVLEDLDPFADGFRYTRCLSYMTRQHNAAGATVKFDKLSVYELEDGTLKAHNSHGVVVDFTCADIVCTKINTQYEVNTIPPASQPRAIDSTLRAIEQQIAEASS